MVAAMMVGTTAFAAELVPKDIQVSYTGLHTVKVSVPGDANDQATILSVKSGTKLDQITNANQEIVYINQDEVASRTTDAQVFNVPRDNTAEFTFDTERFDDDDGEIDIYAAGSTHTVNTQAASIRKEAPVSAIAVDGTGVTVTEGADADALKTAFANKDITLTHKLSDGTTVENPNKLKGNSDGLTYSLSGTTVTVSYTPADTAKHVLADAGTPLTATTTVTTTAAPTVISEAALEATPTRVFFDFGTTPDQITPDTVKEKLTVKVTYEVSQGAAYPDTVLAAGDYSVTLNADKTVATISVGSAQYPTGSDYTGTKITPADITVNVEVRQTAATYVTGTVKSRELTAAGTPGEYADDNGAVVMVYTLENQGEQQVSRFVNAGVVVNGEFSVEVPDADATYIVMVTKAIAKYDTDYEEWGTAAYNRVVVENVQASTPVAEIKLSETRGDVNGDGIANAVDRTLTGANWGVNFTK